MVGVLRAMLCLLFAAVWMSWGVATQAAQPGSIEIRTASFVVAEDGPTLSADMSITLSPALEDALNKGVPLYFVLEFDLVRSRWYWVNEKILNRQQVFRLSYNTLTRQYRVGAGALYQNFSTLQEALKVMSQVRRREDLDPAALRRENTYAASLRLRLDVAQLPKPFQVNALGSRDWTLVSDWYRWTVTP